MLLYFAFIIPILCTIYLLSFHRKDTKWWEILVLFAVVAVAVPVAKFTAQSMQTRDKEWWGNNTVQAVHEEPYDYMSTCYRTVSCGKDCTTTVSYPCVESVSRRTWLQDESGNTTRVSYSKYKELVSRWGGASNEKFVDMNRRYHSYDGDKYIIPWNKRPILAEPLVSQHTWTNKVQASSDVHNYREFTKEEAVAAGLYEYPEFWSGGYELLTILDRGKSHYNTAYGRYWRYLNGKLGPMKKVRLWVVIFRGKSLETARMQEDYWKGGNKNEFIFVIGVDKANQVQWGHIISWTERQKVKIEARNYIAEMDKLDLMKLAKWAEIAIPAGFVKPDFTEKFDYLTINPSGAAIVISFIVILFINIGVCIWIVKNAHHDRVQSDWSNHRSRSSRPMSRPIRRRRGNKW